MPRRSIILLLLLATLPLQGCAVGGFVGAMIETKRRNSLRPHDAEYRGLEGHNWAVVVSADRAIQGEFPDVVPWMTAKISERLVKEQQTVGAAGFVRPEDVLRYQYNNPRWVAMPKGELARELQVDRLIFVELREYRLNEPGNQYLWAGLATGTVDVYEADSPAPDEVAFQKPIAVAFPDKQAQGPNDFSRAIVMTELGRRFVERLSWCFFDHKEPYYPKY